jgi:hypothetical protein
MIGVIEIATATITALAPYLPILLHGIQKAGEKFGDTLASKAGEAAAAKIPKLWGKIKDRFAQHPQLEHAAALVATQPDDSSYQTVFAKALAVYLQQEPQLAQDLLELLGGESAVQKVAADHSSLVEEVTQDMQGTGRQTVEATDNSVVRGIRQTQRK